MRAYKKESRKKDRNFLNWVSQWPCIRCLSIGEVQGDGNYHTAPAHVKSKGSGGDDIGNVVSLCFECHTIQHKIGWREFEKRYGVDATYYAKWFQDHWIAKTEKER